jgi:hypothetical protein
MEARFTIKDIIHFGIWLDKSFNYDRIRVHAVELFNHNNGQFNRKNFLAGTSISERCRIFFNPVDSKVILKGLLDGLEQCLSYELLFEDAVPVEQAEEYRKFFIQSFAYHFKNNLLEK